MYKSEPKDGDFIKNSDFFSALEEVIVKSLNDTYFRSKNIEISIDCSNPDNLRSVTYTFFGQRNLDNDFVEIGFNQHENHIEIVVLPTNNDVILGGFEIRPNNALRDLSIFYKAIDLPLKNFSYTNSKY